MTKYYYAHTNASTDIIAIDETANKCFIVGCDNLGRDYNTNIDIYPDRDEYGENLTEEKIKELQSAYQKMANDQMLYSIKDLENEEPNRIEKWDELENAFALDALLCEIAY